MSEHAKRSSIGNVGGGVELSRFVFEQWLQGIFGAAAVAFAFSAAIFTFLFSVTATAPEKTIGKCYVAASVVSIINDDFGVPGFLCPSSKSAGQILHTIEANKNASADLKIAAIKASAEATIAAIPGVVLFFVIYIVFLLVGMFQMEDVHLRGVRLLEFEDDANEYLDRKIRGVKLQERWFIKRLRSMS